MQKSLMLMPYEQMVGAFGMRVFKEMRAFFTLSLHSLILGDLTSKLDEKTMKSCGVTGNGMPALSAVTS